MLSVVISLAIIALIFGFVLGYSAIRFRVEGNPVVEQIDNLLPQTQCGQCTYAGCRPYAEAIASGEADINQCPPGGETTIIALADLLNVEIKALNDDHGVEKETKTDEEYQKIKEKYPELYNKCYKEAKSQMTFKGFEPDFMREQAIISEAIELLKTLIKKRKKKKEERLC